MIRARLRGEEGLTLIELLVAAAMSVVLVGAAGSMLISAVKSQPQLSKRAQNISTARWVLERMTREIRDGIVVYPGATASTVSFKTQVRRSACGAGVQEQAGKPAIPCRVTYSCAAATSCTRTETAPEVASGGTPTTIVGGLDSSKVFNYSPDAEEPTFIGVTLHIPNPSGGGDLVVSDGAGLRTLSLPR
jgi:type II secretory pathway pseudopilin PulG